MTEHVGFDGVAEAYERFDHRQAGYTKVIVKPGMVQGRGAPENTSGRVAVGGRR